MSLFNDRLNFAKNLFTMRKANHFGGYTSNAASTTMTKSQIARENAYRDLTGMPRITPETITDGVRRLAGFNTGYDLSDTRDKRKDIYVRDRGLGIIEGGTWRNVKGMGLQYDRGPGKGTILGQRNPKTGRIEIGYFNTLNAGRTSVTKDPKVDVKIGKDLIKETPTKGMFSPDAGDVAPDTGIPTGIDDYSMQDDIYSAFQDTTPQVDYSSDDGGDPGGDSGSGGAGGDASDMGFSTAEGGFISRRRATKIKKKQGGLASR